MLDSADVFNPTIIEAFQKKTMHHARTIYSSGCRLAVVESSLIAAQVQ